MAGNYGRVDKAFIFFKRKLKNNEKFTLSELASYTGWAESTLRTYSGKRWKRLFVKTGDEYLVDKSFSKFDFESFRKHQSQTENKKQKFFYEVLVEKAVNACVSAIEIYNKPDFKFREESFSILMVNAWELLLKAKILKDHHDDKTSIFFKKAMKSLRQKLVIRKLYQ